MDETTERFSVRGRQRAGHQSGDVSGLRPNHDVHEGGPQSCTGMPHGLAAFAIRNDPTLRSLPCCSLCRHLHPHPHAHTHTHINTHMHTHRHTSQGTTPLLNTGPGRQCPQCAYRRSLLTKCRQSPARTTYITVSPRRSSASIFH